MEMLNIESAAMKNEEICPIVTLCSNCMHKISFLTLSIVLIGLYLFLKTHSPLPVSFPCDVATLLITSLVRF